MTKASPSLHTGALSLSDPIPGTPWGVLLVLTLSLWGFPWDAFIVSFQRPGYNSVYSFMDMVRVSRFLILWVFLWEGSSPLCLEPGRVWRANQRTRPLFLWFLCVWREKDDESGGRRCLIMCIVGTHVLLPFSPANQPMSMVGSSSWEVRTPNFILVRSSGLQSPGKCTGRLPLMSKYRGEFLWIMDTPKMFLQCDNISCSCIGTHFWKNQQTLRLIVPGAQQTLACSSWMNFLTWSLNLVMSAGWSFPAFCEWMSLFLEASLSQVAQSLPSSSSVKVTAVTDVFYVPDTVLNILYVLLHVYSTTTL